MTHTPGPWTWHDRANDRWTSEQDEGLIRSGSVDVCDFGNNDTYYNTAGVRPKDEDIALICAAPELYDACAAAEDYLAASPFPGAHEIYQQLHAALAKARGEQS